MAMLTQEISKTLSLKRCASCNAALPGRDKFCRRCGIRQIRIQASTGLMAVANGSESSSSLITMPDFDQSPSSLITMPDGAAFQTKRMPEADNATLPRSFSRPLMRTLTQRLVSRTESLRRNRWTIHLFSAVVTVPLWLIIVLMSPLDAYVAAKTIAKQV